MDERNKARRLGERISDGAPVRTPVEKAWDRFELAIEADGSDTIMLLKRAAQKLPKDDPLREHIIQHLRKIGAMQPFRAVLAKHGGA